MLDVRRSKDTLSMMQYPGNMYAEFFGKLTSKNTEVNQIGCNCSSFCDVNV